ncbi:winged helix-turn-helix domain-containing protein [Thomasclavelia sp.]
MKIMIVEDDLVLARELELLCTKWDFQAKYIENFKHVDKECFKYQPDLLLLDVNLPFYDGFYWCQKIRNNSTVPILFISSREQNADKIMALSSGGDDYIEKPFDLEILLVKIKAMLRRTYEYKHLEKEYLDDNTSYDIVSGRFNFKDRVLELTKSESKIMTVLLENRGNWVNREQLMMALWNTDEFVTDATLTVHISRLRNKLKELTAGKDIIKTKKGVGYYID